MLRAPLCVAAIGLASVAVVPAQEVRLPVGDARVTGRVVAADTGAPLVGAEVTLSGFNLPPDLAYRTTTDAAGGFDFQNVYAPREYRVSATKAGFYRKPTPGVYPGEPVVLRERETASGVTVALLRGAAITGRVVDAYGDPVDAIRVYAQRLQYAADGSRGTVSGVLSDVTDDLGRFRVYQLVPGDYLVVATGRSARRGSLSIDLWSPEDQADTVPTFYPGTVDVNEAQVVTLAGGEQSVEIVLRDQRPAAIAGTVRRADGTPAVGLQLGLRSAGGLGSGGRFGGVVGRDGTFRFDGVGPGSYVVEAYTPPTANSSDAARPLEHGTVNVTVGAQDVRDLSIVTSTGAAVSGTVVFERPFTGQSFQLLAIPADPGIGVGLRIASEQIGRDGRFALAGVRDRSRLSVVNPSWFVKSVLVDGTEIGEGVLELGGRTSLTGVQVTVTDRLPEVSFRIVDDRKRPLGDHVLVIARIDGEALPPADRIVTLRSDIEGNLPTRRLRPGSYVAGVVAELEAGEHFAPDFQNRLRQYGHRFALEEGEVLRRELPLTTGLAAP
jgi:hypothetical protein